MPQPLWEVQVFHQDLPGAGRIWLHGEMSVEFCVKISGWRTENGGFTWIYSHYQIFGHFLWVQNIADQWIADAPG